MTDLPKTYPPPRQSWVRRHRTFSRVLLGVGVAYGLFARFVFGQGGGVNGTYFEIMSVSFIFIVPVVIGFLTVFLDRAPRRSLTWVITSPWGAGLITIAGAMALAWEGLICAIVWVPIFCVMGSVGGLIGYGVRRSNLGSQGRGLVLTSFVILPFVLSPLEQLREPTPRYSVAATHIDIAADAAAIWEHIREVEPIAEDEQQSAFSYWIGFPRPVAARLIGEGVGAVREATFQGNVLFVETVTEWVPRERLAFTIEPAPDIPPTTFDEHVVVGGEYFDVLEGTYWLEPLGPQRYRLHLESRHRLGTRFNAYTRLWTDFFMNDIQQHILKVVKMRAEAEV